MHAHLLASKVPGSPEATLTVPLIYTNVGMPTWHGDHMIFTTSENHEFATPRQPCCPASRHPLGTLGAQPLAALVRIAASPRQPCCLALGILSAATLPCTRHPLGSHAAHRGSLTAHRGSPSASPWQPCFAPRHPRLAPRKPIKTPRQPYFSLPQKATSSSQSPLYIQMLACPFGTEFT